MFFSMNVDIQINNNVLDDKNMIVDIIFLNLDFIIEDNNIFLNVKLKDKFVKFYQD